MSEPLLRAILRLFAVVAKEGDVTRQEREQIRSRVGRWGGKISIRSGTARIADIPEWDDAPPLEQDLASFPGAQILIVLPAKGG